MFSNPFFLSMGRLFGNRVDFLLGTADRDPYKPLWMQNDLTGWSCDMRCKPCADLVFKQPRNHVFRLQRAFRSGN